MSKNLNQKLMHLTLIEEWFESEEEGHTLYTLFSESLTASSVFLNIYVSIRRNPEDAQQEEADFYNYYNVGFTPLEITEYFVTKFGLNYFGYSFKNDNDYTALKMRISSIYNANKYKYMKLIETLGYRYNPLFNVDGTELYSRAESIGDAKNTRTPTGTVTTITGTADSGTIGDTTTVFYKNPYDNNSTSASVVDSKSTTTAITTNQSYSENYTETNDYNNIPANNYKYDSTEGTWKPDGIFSVAAKDNAFGVQFNGPERYIAEKRIRQGNIGVTKSTELLRDQRDVVKFNILDEFFNDLQREVVVGIY